MRTALRAMENQSDFHSDPHPCQVWDKRLFYSKFRKADRLQSSAISVDPMSEPDEVCYSSSLGHFQLEKY